MQKAIAVFGEGSVEATEARTAYEKMNKSLIDSQTAANDLRRALLDLNLKPLEYAIGRLTAFGQALSDTVTLKQTRGTIAGDLSSVLTEDDYVAQIANANETIAELYGRIRYTRLELGDLNYETDSAKYRELEEAIEADEQRIRQLTLSNEELKKSIVKLRWKPFEDLQKKLSDSIEDYNHLRSLINEKSFFDDNGNGWNLTEDGIANLTLLAAQIETAEQQISGYRHALDKLTEEYANANISLEEYNERSREYVETIHSLVAGTQDYKDAVVDLYKTQITNETNALEKVISLRRDALSAKRAYYEYDKTLRGQTKDIAQIQS